MSARGKADRLQEATDLHDWSVIIFSFMEALGIAHVPFEEGRQMVAAALAKRDLRMLRALAKELTAWAMHLDRQNWAQLDDRLVSRFGYGLAAQASKQAQAVQRVIKRGVVKTDDEFRLLMSRADEIYADPAKADELQTINRILADAENPEKPNG